MPDDEPIASNEIRADAAQLDLFEHPPGWTEHWQGMPEFDQQDKTAFRSIIVHFKDNGAVSEFCELLNQNVTDKTKMIWFPEIEIETTADKRYSDES